MEDWAILGLGTIIAVLGAFVAIRIYTLRLLDPITVQKKLKLQDEYIKDLEDEKEHWRKECKTYQGKFAQSRQLPKVEGNFDLSSPDGLMAVLHDALPSLEGWLPKEFKGLTRDPKAIEFVQNLIKQNPEKAKEFISKFITSGSKKAEPESSTRTIENLAV